MKEGQKLGLWIKPQKFLTATLIQIKEEKIEKKKESNNTQKKNKKKNPITVAELIDKQTKGEEERKKELTEKCRETEDE